MVSLFRKLRNKLAQKGVVKKYLSYALGEIALIVLGIMIAVKINNSQENEKDRVIESLSLLEIKRGLESDLLDTQINIEVHQNAIESCDAILNALSQALPFHDSLKVHFSRALGYSRFISSIGAFESLKSRGLGIITNHKLREKITHYYDFRLKATKEWEEDFLSYLPIVKQFTLKHFDKTQVFAFNDLLPNSASEWFTDNIYGEMRPIDYKKLSKSEEYKHILRTLKANNIWVLNLNHKIQRDLLVELISDIESEVRPE
ncbi:MAG: hypothetical protein H7246_14470 [Phycisphaerae bacterium]|nr:hypothetical protein [Saprospiraceae bacterium]